MKQYLLAITMASAATLTAGAESTVTIVIKEMMQTEYNITGNKKNFPEWEYMGFKFSTDKKDAANDPMYNKAGDYRVYGGSEMTVSTADGQSMTEIVFSVSSDGLRRWPNIIPSTGECMVTKDAGNTVTWTGDAPEVTFEIGKVAANGTEPTKAGIFQFDKVQLTVSENMPFSSSPTITPAGGKFGNAVTVSISAAENAKIYYTTDGSTPTEMSALYTAPFTLTENTTVKAIAVEEGLSPSNVVSENYEILPGENIISLSDFMDANPDWTSLGVGGDKVFNFIGEYTVAYQNGRMLYVQDATGGLLIAGRIDRKYAVGDVITGFRGTFRAPNGCPQLAVEAASMSDPISHAEYEWTQGTYGEITERANVNRAYLLKSVDYVNNTGTEANLFGWVKFDGGEQALVYNGFSSASEFNPVVYLPEDGKYDIYGITSCALNEGMLELRFMPVEFTISGDTGVNAALESQSVVGHEYYSIDGRRVDETSRGILIMVEKFADGSERVLKIMK